jgi:hypothetical protein
LDQVKSTEPLTRYIMSKDHYRPSDNTVKHNIFMPPRNGELSVYRIENLTSTEIWDIGSEFVSKPMTKKLLGRADFLAQHVYDQGLNVRPEATPHPRHANIYGWPEDKTRIIAIELASKAQLYLLPQYLF